VTNRPAKTKPSSVRDKYHQNSSVIIAVWKFVCSSTTMFEELVPGDTRLAFLTFVNTLRYSNLQHCQ